MWKQIAMHKHASIRQNPKLVSKTAKHKVNKQNNIM